MTKYVYDKIGNAISVGDLVVYAKSKGDEIQFGTIDEIFLERKQVTVRNTQTKRVSVNARYGSELLVIEFLKETNPEFFI